jgi:peptide/nickel transport system ATP-binding protein
MVDEPLRDRSLEARNAAGAFEEKPTLEEAPALEVKDLVKHFTVARRTGPGTARLGPRPVVHAVDGVSFSLYPGRVIALVGESGCGKSTVARLIARLYRPTSGQILLDGEEVRRRSRRAWTGAVQMVFQDPFASLNPLHKIRYQLSRPLKNHRRAGAGSIEDELHRLLARVQLVPPRQFLDKHPHELSGGQRQRIAIARALAAGPRVLVADEPVSMLDVSIRLGVLNLLSGLSTASKLAMLYITHDIASARYSASEILVMYAGELIEGGSAEDVTQRPAHPYTALLVGSAPDPARRGQLASMASRSGEPPDLVNPPKGCRFATRCPHVMTVCTEQSPVQAEVGPGHWARCFLIDGPSGQINRTAAVRASGSASSESSEPN